METAGYLITAAAEFSARMKHREYHFKRRKMQLRMYSRRHPASVVQYADASVGMKCDLYPVAISRKRFVYGIIHYLIYKVMKSL